MSDSSADLLLRIKTLKLSHGQALLVMKDTRLAENMTETALNSMVKKLRLNEVPFEPDEVGTYQWEEIIYRYEHLVELAIALKMLADGMAFRHVVSLVTKYRKLLRKFYREALLEARSERGADRTIINPTPKFGEYAELNIGGMYLDFKATYNNGFLGSPGPVLIGPWEAFGRYMAYYDGLYPFPLIMLSQICERVLKIAEATPPVRRGRRA